MAMTQPNQSEAHSAHPTNPAHSAPGQRTNRQRAFTEFLLDSGALKFGDFTLKSGRRSPYFINAGAFDDGVKIATLGAFYAQTIRSSIDDGTLDSGIDTVFGPAYKGIPLAVATSIAMNATQEFKVGYTFDRKEKKDHGDGGLFVGTQLHDGMRILLVDDVMTAGTAVRDIVPKIKAAADVEIAGLVISVDRMEKAKDSEISAVTAVEKDFGFPVIPIVTVRDIFAEAAALAGSDGAPLVSDELAARANAYLEQYGA